MTQMGGRGGVNAGRPYSSNDAICDSVIDEIIL
jgi:hypothetical protein